METLEQKKRRLYGKQYLNKYLLELNLLTNKPVNETNLLSIIETDNIKFLSDEYNYKITIAFDNKSELADVISKMLNGKDCPCYLFTGYSDDCGALRIDSLESFNIDFSFNDEHSGLIRIISEDFRNKLVLDFFEENNEYSLEIEIYGKNWVMFQG